MRKTNKLIKWETEHDAFEQLNIIFTWARYEDYDIITSCRTLENIVKLFKFLQFSLDIEFVQDAIELANNDSKGEIRNKIYKFNESVGFELIPKDYEYNV